MKTIFRGPEVGDSGSAGFRPNWSSLKLVIIGVLAVLGVLFFFTTLARVTRIEAGYVGVEVNLAGAQRGAADIPVRTGWVFYSPLRTQIIEFPTFVQTVKWTRDLNEGRSLNEEMGFNTKEGMQIFSDVSLSYAIDPVKVPEFYVKYRVNQLELFTHGIQTDIDAFLKHRQIAQHTIPTARRTRFSCERSVFASQQLSNGGLDDDSLCKN